MEKNSGKIGFILNNKEKLIEKCIENNSTNLSELEKNYKYYIENKTIRETTYIFWGKLMEYYDGVFRNSINMYSRRGSSTPIVISPEIIIII